MNSWDDDAGYDRSDPKHPDWGESMLEAGDNARKKAKEESDETRGDHDEVDPAGS